MDKPVTATSVMAKCLGIASLDRMQSRYATEEGRRPGAILGYLKPEEREALQGLTVEQMATLPCWVEDDEPTRARKALSEWLQAHDQRLFGPRRRG